MKQFTSIIDVSDLNQLVESAVYFKNDPMVEPDLGKGKTLGLIFFNPSLRTRLSTQKAAQNLGLSCMVMNFVSEGWQLETEEGVIMSGEKAEHIVEAAGVIGQYCDILGIRAFASFTDQEKDYKEEVLNSFIKYSKIPVVSLESATLHPLQSLADLVTIEEYKKKEKPKVVLSWAPHPRILPQSVANSFTQWMRQANVDLVITHPPGYELNTKFTKGTKIIYDQEKAFDQANFIYVKNWSSYEPYGQLLSQDPGWKITASKMGLTNNAYFMHCLPVRRNVIVDDEVLDGEASLVIPQAANRVYAAQAVLKSLLTTNF